MQTFDGLMRVDYFDFSLGDDFSQTRDDVWIERQTTFKTDGLDARGRVKSPSSAPPPVATKIKSRPPARALRHTSSASISAPPRFKESSK